MKRHVLMIVLFLLLVGTASSADFETIFPCIQNSDCLDAELGPDSYCNIINEVCFLGTTIDNNQTNNSTINTSSTINTALNTIVSTVDTSALEKQVKDLETTVGSINTKTSGLESDVLVVKNDLKNLKTQVSGIQQDITKLNSQVTKGLGDIESTLNTGLASLQGDLETTKTEISSLEENLDKSNTFRNVLLLVIFLVVGGGVAFFLLRKPKSKIDQDVKEYISGHIKQGASYQEIKQVLMQAGWPEQDIENAYKETVKHNYEQYQKAVSKNSNSQKISTQPSASTTTTQKQVSRQNISQGPDKKKIILISIIGIVFLLGAFFLLKATTGQAINFQTNFAHDEALKCTPPHIVSNGGCCLDGNQNNICDTIEAAQAKKATVDATICTTDTECSIGKTCVDNTCSTIESKFITNCPGEFKCNLNSVKIKSSDGEIYTVHAGKGSYAAAGAVDWTISEIPNYCKGQAIKVPITIEKKDLICYDIYGVKISCNENTGLACTSNTDCKSCITSFGSACTCDQTKKTCKLSTVDKIKSEILSKETIILGVGTTSKKISHSNPKLDAKLNGFSLTVMDANEFCFPGN